MWKQYSPEQLAELEEVSSRYKECLNLGKTERECVALAISMAEAKGYKNLKDCIAGREELHPGDKVYAERMGKILALFMLGDRPLEEGMNILGAHIDSLVWMLSKILYTKMRIWLIWTRIIMAG